MNKQDCSAKELAGANEPLAQFCVPLVLLERVQQRDTPLNRNGGYELCTRDITQGITC